MAAFTFYGTSLKGFRAGSGLKPGFDGLRCASRNSAFVLRRVSNVGDVLRSLRHRECAPAVLA